MTRTRTDRRTVLIVLVRDGGVEGEGLRWCVDNNKFGWDAASSGCKDQRPARQEISTGCILNQCTEQAASTKSVIASTPLVLYPWAPVVGSV